MKRHQLIKHIQRHGCVLVKEGSRHSKWVNPADLSRCSVLPWHTEVDDMLAKAICKQLGVPPVK